MRLRAGGGQAAARIIDWDDPDAIRHQEGSEAGDGDAEAIALRDSGELPLLARGDPRVDERVESAFTGTGEVVRSIRGLRSSLVGLRRREGAPVRSIAIIGIDAPMEGALTAANLAVVCAQAGYRTTLIDANVEYPTQNRLFRLPNEAGVTSVLGGRQSWREVVQPTAIDNLSLVAAGPGVTNAGDMFERSPLLEAFDALVTTGDYLIVDATTQGAVEAQLICTGVDGVLVTVKQNRSGTRDLRRMIDRLASKDIPVIGSVFAC